MKQVFYKGQPYDYTVVDQQGKRQFQLFTEGNLAYTVEQSELDIKSIVSLILDAYHRNTQARVQSSQVAQG
jgi:hypothetical protein